jgi:hypothetical protein
MDKTTGLIAAVAACAAAAMAWTASGGAASATCKAGVTTYGGTTARVFCGSATATVHAGGKTFTIRQGSCDKGAKYVSVNIGEIVLGKTSKPKPEYFGLNIGKIPYLGGAPASHDGTYHSGVVAVVHAGKGYGLRAQARVTLTNGRSRGTFSATVLTGGVVTGSFRC